MIPAAELALPPAALESHLYAHEPAGGLLGIDASGALLYLYTVQDEGGAWRFSSVKRRALPHEISSGRPCFTAWKGSQKSTLWGASHIDATLRRVIITEGESDALALRYSLQQWLEMLSTESPELSPDDHQKMRASIIQEVAERLLEETGGGMFDPSRIRARGVWRDEETGGAHLQCGQ